MTPPMCLFCLSNERCKIRCAGTQARGTAQQHLLTGARKGNPVSCGSPTLPLTRIQILPCEILQLLHTFVIVYNCIVVDAMVGVG